MASLFNYFFTIICTLYTFCIITNYQLSIKIPKTFFVIISICLAFTINLFSTSSVYIRMFFLYLFLFFLIFILTKKALYKSIILTVVSYGISLISFVLSCIIIGFSSGVLYALIKPNSHNYPYCILEILVGILQTIIVYVLLKIPQFRKGIKHIAYSNYFISISLIICISLYISLISDDKDNYTSSMQLIASLLLAILSLLLLYYWRHRIKQTYIENMRRLETLTYENTIADKDKQIKSLEDSNAYLGQIIHKYRKTIPAMELSVMELLQNCEKLTQEELKTKAESLQTQLIELQEDRDNLLDKYQKEANITARTGLHTVDAMLALMEKRAKQEWIRYKTQINPDICKTASGSIKEADLLHLLGDLTENAFHAVDSTDNKDILIHFGKMNDYFLLEISDSGYAFDVQTYQNFGIEPSTSHKDDGGSGTGLLDIWKIKKEYKASLYIYEYEPGTNIYTKKISFLFDGKNHFLLKTYREQEVKNALLRGDIHVFPHQTD